MRNNQILIKTSIQSTKKIQARLTQNKTIPAKVSNNASGGTTNYELLSNKPQINDVTLIGNKLSNDLHLQDKMDAMTIQEVQSILYNNAKRRRKQ